MIELLLRQDELLFRHVLEFERCTKTLNLRVLHKNVATNCNILFRKVF